MNNLPVDSIVDECIKENTIYRFATELQNTTCDSRKEDIKSILSVLQKNNNADNTDDAREKLKDYYSKLDEYSMKKSWHRLREIQKIDRLNDYLKTIIKDADECKNVSVKLTEMIKNGNLGTAKYVSYNTKDGKIECIKNLIQDDKTKKYNVTKTVKTIQAKNNVEDLD